MDLNNETAITEKLLNNFLNEIMETTFIHTCKSIDELNKNNITPLVPHLEIRTAVEEIVLDKVIELTKDMEQEQILRLLTLTSIANVLSIMNDNPMLIMALKVKHKLL